MKTKPKPTTTPTNGRDEAGRFRRGQAPKPKPTPTLVVERVNLHTLHEDPSNPNTHPENDIKDLMAKLATFGQVEPLVVQLSTRKVIGGNGRLEAMRRLGWVQCDVTMVDCDNVTATALGISLNRRKSLFDDSVLVAQLQAIQSENADLMDAVGYDRTEIDALIAGLKRDVTPAEDPGAQVDRAEELLAKWKVQPGQLWVVPSKATPGGEHRVLCGDSTKAEDVARVMGGEKVDAVVTDPPYGIDYHHRGTGNPVTGTSPRTLRRFAEAIANDDRPFDPSPWLEFPCLMWGANHYALRIPEGGSWLVWDKAATGGPEDSFVDGEFAWTSTEGVKRNVFRYLWKGVCQDGEKGQRKVHPTQKPAALMSWSIKTVSPSGPILDPFLGSGTTIVAAEQTGRLARGIELTPKYVAVTLERLSGLGLEPKLSTACSG